MSRALLVLVNQAIREKAIDWITRLPQGTRVEFRAPQRTLPQNAKMWAMLTDISEQQLWHGLSLEPDEWKDIFAAALNRELRMVPNLDGTGIVVLGRSTSKFSVEEMANMIELMFAWSAGRNIVWTDPKELREREREAAA